MTPGIFWVFPNFLLIVHLNSSGCFLNHRPIKIQLVKSLPNYCIYTRLLYTARYQHLKKGGNKYFLNFIWIKNTGYMVDTVNVNTNIWSMNYIDHEIHIHNYVQHGIIRKLDISSEHPLFSTLIYETPRFLPCI